MDEGRCKGMNPSIFIMDKGRTTAKAQKFCRNCDVREPCFQYGLRTGSVGVWGGRFLQLNSNEIIELFPLREVEVVKPEPVKEEERVRKPSIFGGAVITEFPSRSPSIFGTRAIS